MQIYVHIVFYSFCFRLLQRLTLLYFSMFTFDCATDKSSSLTSSDVSDQCFTCCHLCMVPEAMFCASWAQRACWFLIHKRRLHIECCWLWALLLPWVWTKLWDLEDFANPPQFWWGCRPRWGLLPVEGSPCGAATGPRWREDGAHALDG